MKKIAGKTFKSSEEAGLPPLTAERIEEVKRIVSRSRKIRDAIPPDQRRQPMDDRFTDVISGTEFDPNRPPTRDDDNDDSQGAK